MEGIQEPDLDRYLIKDDDEIAVFGGVMGEFLDTLGLKNFLDIGMFYKRIAAVSRTIMDFSIPEDVRLSGVDFVPDLGLEVYRTIYDEVISWEDFISGLNQDERFFDAVILLSAEDILAGTETAGGVYRWLAGHSRFLLTDYRIFTGIRSEVPDVAFYEVRAGNKSFEVLSFDRK